MKKKIKYYHEGRTTAAAAAMGTYGRGATVSTRRHSTTHSKRWRESQLKSYT